MMRNMSRGIPRLWKDGYKSFSGLEEAIFKNCEAASALAQVVRTSFGPNGLSKIVINRVEKVIVTTDAATIIDELEVQHPAAKVLCLSAAMQQREIGDGANFVVVFAGELLTHAVQLMRIGLHPSDIIRGYEKAGDAVQEFIKELVVYEAERKDMHSKDVLMLGVKAAVSSKQYVLQSFLTNLIADACLNCMPQIPSNFLVDNIRTVKILGSSVINSFMIQGMVIESAPTSSQTFMENTKVAIFTCSLDSTQTETKGTVLLHSANELLNYNQSEEDHIHNVVKGLRDMGVGIIIVAENISDMAMHYIDKYHLFCMRIVSKWTTRRLCRTLRARPVVTLTGVRNADLGFCAKVFTREIGNKMVSVFQQEALGDSEVSTIVIRGATATVMNDVERAIDDGVNMVRAMTRNGKFVAGAGACEIELARRLQKFADTKPGLEQYAIKKFGEALEVVPRTLAENTGLDATKIISNLYNAHAEVDTSDVVPSAAATAAVVDATTEATEASATNAVVVQVVQENEQKTDADADVGMDDSVEESAAGDDNNIAIALKSKIRSSTQNIGVDIVNGGIRDMTRDGVIDLMATREMGLKLAAQAAITILRVDHIIMKKPAGGPRKPKNRGHWDANDDTW